MKLSEMPSAQKPTLAELATPDNLRFYQGLRDGLESLARELGTNSSGFRQRCDELLNAPDVAAIKARMTNALYIRPLLSLWLQNAIAHNGELAEHISHLASSSRLGRLNMGELSDLCMLFLKEYDRSEALPQILNIIQGVCSTSEADKLFARWDQKARSFFCANGPVHLASLARAKRISPFEAAAELGLPTEDSRFFEVALSDYYLTELTQLHNNQDSHLLNQIRRRKIAEITTGGGRLGKIAALILLEKLAVERVPPSATWLEFILSQAENLNQCEDQDSGAEPNQLLKGPHGDFLRRHLAQININVFARILAEDASTAAANLNIWYAELEIFLRALDARGFIKNSWLFAGKKYNRFIRRIYQDRLWPRTIYICDAPILAVIGLDLGEVFLMAGTRDFHLRIYESQLAAAYGVTEVESRALFYASETDSGHFETGPVPNWQRKAVNFLQKHGLDILEKNVAPPDRKDYPVNLYLRAARLVKPDRKNAFTHKISVEGMEFTPPPGFSPRNPPSSLADLQFLALEQLYELEYAEHEKNIFYIKSEVLCSLDTSLRHILQLPGLWPYYFEVESKGKIENRDFSLSVKARAPNGDTFDIDRHGPAIFVCNREFLLTEAQWLALRAVERHNTLSAETRSEAENLLLIHALHLVEATGGRVYATLLEGQKRTHPRSIDKAFPPAWEIEERLEQLQARRSRYPDPPVALELTGSLATLATQPLVKSKSGQA